MLTVRFIRHGESLANAGGITSETHSIPLTDRGWAQALEVSESFTAAPALLVASPYLRAHDTAKPTVARFPLVPFEIWPVQEFTYLAAERCLDTTTAHRLPWATAFWTAADPHYVDGGGAEILPGSRRPRASAARPPCAAHRANCHDLLARHVHESGALGD